MRPPTNQSYIFSDKTLFLACKA